MLVNYKLWSGQSGSYGERPPTGHAFLIFSEESAEESKLYEGDDGVRWVWGPRRSVRLPRRTSAPTEKRVYVWFWVGGVGLAGA